MKEMGHLTSISVVSWWVESWGKRGKSKKKTARRWRGQQKKHGARGLLL